VTASGGAHDSARTSARFVPWGPVAGTAGALAAGAALLLVRRRRRRTGSEEAGVVAEAPYRESELTGAVT
jgi:LPXTG-motif cell wall-anchored protein